MFLFFNSGDKGIVSVYILLCSWYKSFLMIDLQLVYSCETQGSKFKCIKGVRQIKEETARVRQGKTDTKR